MTKKRILFVNNNMHSGGAEKSLINLLSQIDLTRYEVDLCLFEHKGIFIDLIPQEIRILPQRIPEDFWRPTINSMWAFIRKGNLKMFWLRLCLGVVTKACPDTPSRYQTIAKYLAKSMPSIDEEYDIVVAYKENSVTYYTASKTIGKRKIAFYHSDYLELRCSEPSFDKQYFNKFNAIVSVSESSADSLKTAFPELSSRIKVLYNIISPDLIYKMSKEKGFEDRFDGFRMVTVARLSPPKGLELGIQVTILLKEHNINIKWYIIGEGIERTKLEKLIKRYDLSNYVILLGEKANPYPFIAQSDIYIQPSETESFGLTVAEAKVLKKPIIVTDIPAFREQIRNGENGLIVKRTANDFSSAIQHIINSEELRLKFKTNLCKESFETKSLKEFYKLLQFDK